MGSQSSLRSESLSPAYRVFRRLFHKGGKRNVSVPSGFGFLRAGVLLWTLPALVMWGCGALEQDKAVDVNPAPACGVGWASRVLAVNYGEDATFGQSQMPGVVLGPSSGTGTGAQSLDVVSLGAGGSITVGFSTGCCALDGDGDDLAVMENVFFIAGDESNRFIEAARVAVSQDGIEFYEFPTSVDETLPLGDPQRYSGFAGVEPVYPGELPGGVGGDRFDLADVGLPWIRFVRITDANGAPEDPGDIMSMGYGMNGFDLDTVGAVHAGSGDECEN